MFYFICCFFSFPFFSIFSAQFTCNECNLLAFARINVIDIDNELEDIYELDVDRIPHVNLHNCIRSGIENFVDLFHNECNNRLRKNPTLAVPDIYKRVRTEFCADIKSQNEKVLFLDSIKDYDVFQTKLYSVKREYIPASPSSAGGYS